MADDQRIELPTRDNNLTVHENSNVESRPDTRVDLTQKAAPETTVSPDQKPEETEITKEEPKDAEAPKDEDLETLKRKRKELEEDNFKYRDRIRREREEKEELKSRLDKLESSVSKVSSDSEFEAQVKETQAELGVDEEAAKKLVRTVKKLIQPKQDSQPVSEIQKAAKNFQSESLEAMEEYSDWEDHRAKMTELLEADIRAKGELKALKRGPLYYYAESRRLSQGDPDSAKAEGKKEMAQKVNQKNLATSESSRNSQGRPSVPFKWTKEKADELIRNNPQEYEKRRLEIFRDMNS